MNENGIGNTNLNPNNTYTNPVLIPMDNFDPNQNVVKNPIENQQQTVNGSSTIPETKPITEPQTSIQSIKLEKGIIKEKKKVAPPPPEETIKKQSPIFRIVIGIIVMIIGIYSFYTTMTYKREIKELKFTCSPVTSTKESTVLDIKSTLVQSLYSKVKTSIREDIAQPNWDDTMKLYLAYRQISPNDLYDSNCNMFNPQRMEPYTCEISLNFVPKAFLKETLELEWKKLFGEETEMPSGNIKLTNGCIGGYEYIPEREEYVQGYCGQQMATSFKVSKTLSEATSTKKTIILKEEVKYYENEKMNLPSYLKSGTYYYKFRLDMNYNYVLVSKTYKSKY